MPALKGIIRNGQVILAEPADWPDGAEVQVRLVMSNETRSTWDDEGTVTPEEIAHTLAAMDRVEPFEMADEERADIEAWRQKVKEYTIAHTHEGIEELFP